MLDYIDPEWDVAPLLDSGTDLEDELPSPDVSPMVISHAVSLLLAQVEEDVDLAQILAEFGTLPAIVTPINDPQEARVMPPAEYRPPEAPADVFVKPAGPADDDGRSPTGSAGCSPIALAAPAAPTLVRNLFPGQTWISPPSGGETAGYRLPTVPLPSRSATVSQPVGELDTLRERVSVPDLSREGPFDIHRDRLHSDASPRSCQDSQGCPFRITSYDLEIVGTLSYVQMLQQLGTALHGASANVMGAVRGRQPFPTHAMQHALPSSPGSPLHDGNGSVASVGRAGDTRTSTGGDVHYLHVLRRLLPGSAPVSQEAKLD